MSGGERYTLRRVIRYGEGAFTEEEVPVIAETPLTVYLNGREIITLLASDDALDYLAVGFLASEGLVKEKSDIRNVDFDDDGTAVRIETDGTDPLAAGLLERRTVTSGCGKGTTFYHVSDALQVKSPGSGPEVSARQILDLMKELHGRSELYRTAGGVHNAALCSPEGILVFRDDIGRHNAIDKIHGECFMEGIDVSRGILVTTGRISSEILIKAGKIGVPVIASRSTPTTLALELAERIGVTVVGRVRAGGLTVYTGRERVRTS
jgi:FdhD protein